jgi:hypothetical protein
MMHLGLVGYIVWFGTPCVLAGVLAAMYRRGIHRFYPYFFVYAIAQVLFTAILATVSAYSSFAVYYYSYCGTLVLTTLLSAAVIWNVIKRVLVKRPLRPLTSMFFYLCVAIIVIAVIGFAINGAAIMNHSTVFGVLLLSDRLVRIVQVLLAVAIILVGRYFAISRKSFVFGLVFGFGTFAVVNSLVFSSLVHHGVISDIALSRINASAYLFACFVWLYYSIFGTKDCQRFDAGLTAPISRDIRKSAARNRWFMRTAYDGGGTGR